jgi:hypothetical protein
LAATCEKEWPRCSNYKKEHTGKQSRKNENVSTSKISCNQARFAIFDSPVHSKRLCSQAGKPRPRPEEEKRPEEENDPK